MNKIKASIQQRFPRNKKTRIATNKLVRNRNAERNDKHDLLRREIASIFLKGRGVEIGALHKPLNVPENKVDVIYIDRLSTNELQKQYPNIEEPFIEVDIIDDGETLKKIKNNSQDFIIANHFYEHCADPISTLLNLLRVIKPSGGIFMAIPDKRYTFDKKRKNTTFRHVKEDYEEGPAISKNKHLIEWITEVNNITNRKQIIKKKESLIKNNESIHYHTWDYETLIDYFIKVRKYLNDPFEISLVARNFSENIVYLTKK